MNHCFISYSNAETETSTTEFAFKLADKLKAGPPSIDIWIDDRSMHVGDWDEQVSNAIKTCKCLLFLVSPDSVAEGSICTDEWNWAIKYKKPIIPLILQKSIEVPFRLSRRNFIDFTSNFEIALSKLRNHIDWIDSPEGFLQSLKDRLGDAQRDLRRNPDNSEQIQSEINDLRAEIKANEFAKNEPKKAQKQTRDLINAGLERDREPVNPIGGKASSKFINPRPGSIPDYFEGRLIETQEIADFLRNDFQRIMIINGRAGSGKTVLACRVLQQLENGGFPNELGEFKVGGIVYLSEIGNYKTNVANIFSGLLQLIEPQTANKLEELYKEAKVPVDEKVRSLLTALPSGLVILLMDNFENLLNPEDENIIDQDLQVALTTILQADTHNLKVLITTRELPRQLNMIESARQYIKHLDEGLPSPFAENVLRKMDKDGHAGLRDGTDEMLNRVREATLGYPRALEAVYAILRVDRYSSVEELLGEELPETVVEKYVGEAFSRLDPTRQKIIQTLAVYNRPVSSSAVDFALQFHISGVNSAPILERLVSMHFVRREAKRYFLHPADRDYALSRMPKGNIDNRIGQGARARTWDQHSLILRAADYFIEVRKPRAEWKKLDDLAAQLAEFELRCEAGDYDTAASVLTEFDGDYLFLWGHYQLMIDLHERISAKITDLNLRMSSLNRLEMAFTSIGDIKKSFVYIEQGLSIARKTKNRKNEGNYLGNLGNAYYSLGDAHKAIEFHEQDLAITRQINDRTGEGAALGNIGNAYATLGDVRKAIDFYEQALIICREIGNEYYESVLVGNIGSQHRALGNFKQSLENYRRSLKIKQTIGDRQGLSIFLSETASALVGLAEYQEAKENYAQAIQIADEISFPETQSYARCGLALAYLFQNDLVNARATIKTALQYDVPQNNHNTSALHGIIALQQAERETAQEAFAKSIAQADEILAKTPDYYSALDAKGLSICGLLICDLRLAGRGDPSMPTETNDGKIVPPDKSTVSDGRVAPTVDDAIETFRKARKIAPHAGVVKSVLRLFDELVKCEGEEILKDVREVIAGS